MIESVESVQNFLTQVKSLLYEKGRCSINNSPWVGKANKTQIYMAETGITMADIKAVIEELTVHNYCATKDERNSNFQGERVWEFGIRKKIVDVDEDLYIKLKIRKIDEDYLVIMSFHPEQPLRETDKLQFPYKSYEE